MSMNPERARQMINKLRALAAEVGREIDALDTTQRTCGECGLKHFLDWDEQQWAQALGAAVTRLERTADAIERDRFDSAGGVR